jgi:hypothetical protein
MKYTLYINFADLTENKMSMDRGWASGEPNSWVSSEKFVEWRFGDVYGFNDVGEEKMSAFICEKGSKG